MTYIAYMPMKVLQTTYAIQLNENVKKGHKTPKNILTTDKTEIPLQIFSIHTTAMSLLSSRVRLLSFSFDLNPRVAVDLFL